MKVVELDPETGRFPGAKRATVVKSESINLDEHRSLVVVPVGGFTEGMVKNMNYFEEVITFEELETIIIKEDLTDKVPSLRDRIGINKAAKAYRPFLWIHWDNRREGNKQYSQLILTNPLTLEDYFLCETFLDYVWAGVSDQNNHYPSLNSLLDYISDNSQIFEK